MPRRPGQGHQQGRRQEIRLDNGTRLNFRIDAASGLGGVFGKLADRFVEQAQARTVRANLETLAELLAEHPEYGRDDG